MENQQFEQWKEFSTKAIEILNITDARKEKLRVNIAHFFGEVEQNWGISDIDDWEDIMTLFYDFFADFYVKSDKEKCSSFQSQLHAIIRSGIDVVSGNVGVVDWFSAGDIKSMFGGQIPKYVTDRFTPTAFDDDENILPF